MQRELLMALADSISASHGIDSSLFRRLIKQESGWNPTAESSAGAAGLTQLMPMTAHELGVTDRFDPTQSLDGGARYLKQMLDRFNGDTARALAAYNAGPGTVDRTGGVPNIPETQNYVNSILGDGAPISVEDLPTDILKTLMEHVDAAFKPAQDTLRETHVDNQNLRFQATSAQNDLMREANAPVPEAPQSVDLMTRTLGNIADMLSGGTSGYESANALIAGERANIMGKRAERLKLKADNAERLANEAAKHGLAEVEMKHRTVAEKASKDAEAALQALDITARNINSKRTLVGNREQNNAENLRERLRQDNANIRALIDAGVYTINENGELRAVAGTRGRPTEQQWNSIISRVAADSETRGGTQKDEQLRGRYLNLVPPGNWTREKYAEWLTSLSDKNGNPLFSPKDNKHRERARRAADQWFPR